MKLVFVDTDVMLDYLLKREPYFDDALNLMNAGAIGRVRILVSVVTIANITYFLRKKFTPKETQQKLKVLRSFTEITVSDNLTVDEMLESSFSDLEDGLQHASALRAGADFLITRNKKDYKHSMVVVMSADELLKKLK
jgi:predicted nucleic acid-binding protein